MSWKIGTLTLPRPSEFTRKIVETSATTRTVEGKHKRDITNQKEQFVLKFSLLNQTQATAIYTEYQMKEVLDFIVDEGSLQIPATPVHLNIPDREYSYAGNEYREDLTLVLTEVV